MSPADIIQAGREVGLRLEPHRGAFDKARETIEKRKQELQEALSQAGQAGWPQLTGSEKQIAWAERIRAKLAAIHPENRALKTATTAKYWIENWSQLR